MDAEQIAVVLSSQSTAQSGQTVAQTIDAALSQIPNPSDLMTLILARQVQKSLDAANAAAPTITAPANAAAVATFLLTEAGTTDYPQAYLTLKQACQGFLASPQTNTWDDVCKALLILPTVILHATPHLKDL